MVAKDGREWDRKVSNLLTPSKVTYDQKTENLIPFHHKILGERWSFPFHLKAIHYLAISEVEISQWLLRIAAQYLVGTRDSLDFDIFR